MIPYTTPIAANGTYTLDAVAGRTYLFYASGNFAGRTVTFGYVDGVGAFAPFRNDAGDPLTTTESDGVRGPCPPSGKLAVLVEGGAGTPAITLNIYQKS